MPSQGKGYNLKFNGISGHSDSIGHLKKLIEVDRVPHAMLFTGPEGIGKRMVAVATAASLNCSSGSIQGMCGECDSCVKLRAGTHPLVKFVGSPKDEKSVEIDFGSGLNVHVNNIVPLAEDSKRKKITVRINIEQIREVIKEVSLSSYGSGKKVFIIDDIALSSTEALNCLLKVLEEPSKDTYFMLVTSREELLLPTIMSRCHRFEFAVISDIEMNDIMNNKFEPDYIDDKRKKELISLSSGSPGRMLRFMELGDVDLAGTEPEVFFENVRKWFSDNSECIDKLKVLLEMEGIKFRRLPTEKGYSNIKIITDTINGVKSNANAELAVSNMFLQMGSVEF